MCQLFGIIHDDYVMKTESGLIPQAEEVVHLIELFDEKEMTNKGEKHKLNKQIKNGKVWSEKYQLMCLASDINSGILYWEAALDYLYKIVLTSDDDLVESRHVCRNKICHGIQNNYGDQEHALKAILSVNLVTRLSALMATYVEEQQEEAVYP